jgi:hypothetical protein
MNLSMNKMNGFSLEHSILAALIYADIFDVPLTAEETWRNLFSPQKKDFSFFDIFDALEHASVLSRRVESRGGFYFLKGREEIVRVRLDRYGIAKQKYDRAQKIISLLAGLPYVRLICVCNTLGWSNARDESDIDIFIVARHGHIWLTRALCAGLMQIIGLRPQKHHTKDTICLSFFVSDVALDVSSLFLPESDGMKDIYFLYWLLYCVPLYDSGGVYEKFWETNKRHILSALPYATQYDTNEYRRVKISWARKVGKNILEWCGGVCGVFLERVARWVQLRVLPQDLRVVVNKDTRVIMNDAVMKFHPHDRREEIRSRFYEKFQDIQAAE